MFVLIGLHPDPPGVTANPQARVQWYLDHKNITAISGFGGGYFAFLMAFFAVGVRKLLRSGEAGESTYSSAALVGGVLVSVAATVGALITLGSLEAANKHQAAVLTTFAFLNDFGWLPTMVGFGVFYLATGLGGLRTATLPKWLSIVTNRPRCRRGRRPDRRCRLLGDPAVADRRRRADVGPNWHVDRDVAARRAGRGLQRLRICRERARVDSRLRLGGRLVRHPAASPIPRGPAQLRSTAEEC